MIHQGKRGYAVFYREFLHQKQADPDLKAREQPQILVRQRPTPQQRGLETIGKLRVGLNGIERIMRADGDDRDLQFIAQILDDIEKVPLLEHRSCKHVLDLVNDQHFHADGRQELHDLTLQISRRFRWSKRRKDFCRNRLIEAALIGYWCGATIAMNDEIEP